MCTPCATSANTTITAFTCNMRGVAAVVMVMVSAGATAGSVLLMVAACVVCLSGCRDLVAVVMMTHGVEGTGAIATTVALAVAIGVAICAGVGAGVAVFNTVAIAAAVAIGGVAAFSLSGALPPFAPF
jgi:hypothetical protein